MNAVETMKSLTYGTELEYTGIARERAAREIQKVVGGTVRYAGTGYQTWEVTAADGRVWKCMRDGSLGPDGGCEVVTPILRWEDMDTLQEVVRVLRHAGAKATRETSQHVHIGAKDIISAEQIARLAKIFYKNEELILKMAGTWEHRLEHYTARTDRDFIERLEHTRYINDASLNRAWFGRYNFGPSHYDQHRYHDINLNNIWRTGTIEFRLYNGTTHAGEVKAHILLSLALTAKAMNSKAASSKNRKEYKESSAKYDARVFLLSLGIIGDEFKNMRMHLLKHLPGSAAWKNGRRAA